MTSYEEAVLQLQATIELGYDVEEEGAARDFAHLRPAEAEWLASWIVSEGWVKQSTQPQPLSGLKWYPRTYPSGDVGSNATVRGDQYVVSVSYREDLPDASLALFLRREWDAMTDSSCTDPPRDRYRARHVLVRHVASHDHTELEQVARALIARYEHPPKRKIRR